MELNIYSQSQQRINLDKILNIISNNECVYGSYGIHPHEAKNHRSLKSDEIVKKVKLTKNNRNRREDLIFIIIIQIKMIRLSVSKNILLQHRHTATINRTH